MEDVDNRIDWSLISHALSFYKELGYKEIEVPWHVREEVSNITCPSPELAFNVKLFGDEVLVGSAEQSMIQMMIDGTLPDGKYVTCTPCFRNEPIIDYYHQKYFMKVELFHAGTSAAARCLGDAKKFFQTVTNKKVEMTPYRDGYGFDLEIDGIEIGSYNFRTCNDIKWTCGTGLALPRFSKVK